MLNSSDVHFLIISSQKLVRESCFLFVLLLFVKVCSVCKTLDISTYFMRSMHSDWSCKVTDNYSLILSLCQGGNYGAARRRAQKVHMVQLCFYLLCTTGTDP